MNIIYKNSLDGIAPEMLEGFFDGWQNCPSKEKHLDLLKNSDFVVVAIDEEKQRVVGFVTAISDKVLSVFIPLIEVLPEYKNLGIGKELLKKILEKTKDFYMVDVICDKEMISFYEKNGFLQTTGMSLRRYDKQGG